MKNILRSGLVAMAMFLMAACAGPGKLTRIAVNMPDGGKATIVAHNQIAPDWLLDRKKLALNFIVKSDVSSKQLAAVAETERACRIYTKTVRPSQLVAVASSGVIYAAAGYIGVGLGSKAFDYAVTSQYAKYGALASGFGGVANGIISAGGQTYTFENCGREVLALFPEYQVHVLQKSPY